MSDETISERLARHYIGLTLGQIPGAVVKTAKLHILDSIGCLLAGSRLEPGRLAYELAGRIAGSSDKPTMTLPDEVQAMATAAHCGELDDIHGGAGVCIGAMIVPALLALAERHDSSGPRFIEAAVAGYETTIRVGLSIDAPRLFAAGWWPSTICGAFGVAVAGARFLNFSAEQTANALGIAALHCGGLITGGQEGATARHLAFGHTARAGVMALLAAEQGFTGPKRALEDPRGFCPTLSASPKWDVMTDFSRYYLPEVAFKPYPCARQLHAGVEALLKLLSKRNIAAEKIDAIELAVPTQNAAMVNRSSTPSIRAATLGSGQYVMAVAALRGTLDLASFDDEFLVSNRVRALMAKVTVAASPDLDRHFPKYWSGRVTLKSDGSSYAEEVIVPKGEEGNPMSEAEMEAKFLSLAEPIRGKAKATAILRHVQELEKQDSLAALIDTLGTG